MVSTTSRPTAGHRLARAVVVDLAALVALASVLSLCVPPLQALGDHLGAGHQLSALPLDRLVVTVAAAALGCCGLWLVAVVVATTVEAVSGVSWAAVRSVSPPVVRRVVLVACGLVVGGVGATPAVTATTGDETGPATSSAPRSLPASLDGLSLPDRTLGATAPGAPRTPRPPDHAVTPARPGTQQAAAAVRTHVVAATAAAHPTPRTYVVRHGDCLWSIAEAALPVAGIVELDAAWRRLHRANRGVIGPDPDLLLPGVALRLTPGLTAGPAAVDGPVDRGTDHHRRKDAS